MDTRTRVCVWIIALGLANFVTYTIGWAVIGGESMNGYIRRDGGGARRFFMVRQGAAPFEVSRTVWVYSAIHSITLPLTVGAVVLSMLTLAKDRLVASMRATIVRGRAFMTLVAAGVGLLAVLGAAYFTWWTVVQLTAPAALTGAASGHP